MELQIDLDLHGHRLMNQGDGGFPFDSGMIRMHNDLNTNNYRVVGSDGGGFEIEDGRLKMHGEIDLNGHGLRDNLSFSGGDIVLQKGESERERFF